MKHTLIQTGLFLLFVCALGASIYGSLTTDTIPSRAVGAMQIAPFESGLALYQGYRGHYYPISPFNDYTITREATRSAYIPYDVIQNKRYTTSYKRSHASDIIQSLTSYLVDIEPSIRFESDRYKIDYKAEIIGNMAVLHRTVHDTYSWGNPAVQAITIPYKGPDFIFDATGQLHHYQIPSDIEEFERMYYIDLEQNLHDVKVPLRKMPVVIVNPRLSGAIVVRPQDGQNLYIDRNNKLITVEQSILNRDGDYEMTLQLEVYDDPGKAIQSL